jgi:hypothetical protein
LHRGLAGIPTNVLTARLKELEQGGVVRRRLLPRPSGSIIYELTEYGAELEDVVVHLGRWGAKALGNPRCDEVLTVDSMITAMRSTFRPEAARKVRASYEFRFGDIVINVRIDGKKIEVAEGPLPGADLIVQTGPAIRALMSGEMTAAEAIGSGSVHLTGDPELLSRFAEMFRIDPMPKAASL